MRPMRRLALGLAALLLWAAPLRAQLSLSDFATPAGDTLIMAFVGVAATPIDGGGPWARLFWDPTNSQGRDLAGSSIAEGDADLASDLTVAAIRCANATRCQMRRTGDAGYATYFEDPPAAYDDGTWFWQDADGVLSADAVDVDDARVGGGFLDFNDDDGADTGAIAAAMFGTNAGDRFILAFTRPAPPPATDNCDIYLGSTDLTAPSDLRLGALTPTRVYLGSTLVCGT